MHKARLAALGVTGCRYGARTRGWYDSGMNKINAFGLSTLAFAVATTFGCASGGSGTAASANAATASSSTTQPTLSGADASPGSASNSPYPAWAAAAVPSYPSAIDRMLVRDDFYQIDSADDAATVLAWYKSHVPGAWTTAGSPDNALLTNANGVRIEVDKLGYGNEPVGARPRTMICLNRVISGETPSSC